jgi:hypothetical protein
MLNALEAAADRRLGTRSLEDTVQLMIEVAREQIGKVMSGGWSDQAKIEELDRIKVLLKDAVISLNVAPSTDEAYTRVEVFLKSLVLGAPR